MKTTTKRKYDERTRFNWGFHAATFDSERGKPKLLGVSDDPNQKQVNGTFDLAYAEGYACGLRSYEKRGTRERSSSRAWAAYKFGEEANSFS